MTAHCKSCGEPLDWARTETGRPIPLDVEPHPNGNVVIAEVHRDGSRTVHVLSKAEMATDMRQRRFAHFATCGVGQPPVTPLPAPQPEQDHLVLE